MYNLECKEGDFLSGLRKFVIFLAILVVAIPACFFTVVYSKLKTMHVEGDFDMLTSNQYKYDDEIVNILLIGSDARPGETVSRSDSMMILTVDNKHKKLKLTSLGRDTFVDIPGHGFQKLTHAYAFGKEKLLIETIEKNFKLDLQNYAKVDFFSFIDIVDAIGGIDVSLTEPEINEMNKFIKECYSWDQKKNKPPMHFLEKTGPQKLEGYQALAFARIRHNDGTMERDDRQRQVIEAIIKKVSTMPMSRYPKLLDSILPYVKTNMNPTQIMSLGMTVLQLGDLHLTTMQFPLHPENEIRLPKSGYVIPFEQYEIPLLHDFIFDNKKPSKEDIEKATKQWKEKGEASQYSNDPEFVNAGAYY